MGTVWTEPEKYLTEIHQALGCHSAYMVEEIERLKDREDELGQQVTTLERDKSQLRADLAAAQRERDEARARVAALEAKSRAVIDVIKAAIEHGYTSTSNTPLDGYGVEVARELISDIEIEFELSDDTDPLTPRRCVTCAQEAAREMRQKCADLVQEFDFLYEFSGCDRILICERDGKIADAIRALPLPSCDGCNPLKPEAKNEVDQNMSELLKRAATVMNDTGNALNWPDEIPMSYAEMINELRDAAESEATR